MLATNIGRNKAFSLIELVIVVVIIGIIAAIAIPRMSRGATGAADGAVSADLATLRNAIDLFQAEHQGQFPDLINTPKQLFQYTDEANTTVSATKTATCCFGPYIRAIPPLPVGAAKGQTACIAPPAGGNTAGWVYTIGTGTILPNTTTETDSRGVLFSSY